MKTIYKVNLISYQDCKPWILKKHYAHRIPSISHSFGLFKKNDLVGICTFGSPPSPSLCIGICGKQYKKIVYELNRLCLMDNLKNESSFLIAQSIKLMPKPSILVSYADTGQNHVGYVYQATNWIYTGLSAKRTDFAVKGLNIHQKTLTGKNKINDLKKTDVEYEYKQRSQKHRYVYFTGSKKEKKQLFKDLKYPILDYPKGESINYDSNSKIERQMQFF